MKKLGLIVIVVMLLTFVGCESIVEIEAPSNLDAKVAGSDSLDLSFTWTATTTTDIDGYRLYWNSGTKAGDSIIWEGTGTTCTIDNPPIGKFYVTAYKGTKSESDPSNEFNTAPVIVTGQGPIYYISDPSPTHPSGYYWNADGTGSTVALSGPDSLKTDMYLDASDCLVSPRNRGNHFHETGFKESTSTFDNLAVADQTGYITGTTAVSSGKVYVLWLTDTKQYVKVEVSSYDATAHSVTFRYALQKIAGYRRFK